METKRCCAECRHVDVIYSDEDDFYYCDLHIKDGMLYQQAVEEVCERWEE